MQAIFLTVTAVMFGIVAIAAATAPVLMQTKFQAGCALPFDETKIRHKIDNECGREGEFTHERYRVQNLAKNNFCASGKPALATFKTFDALHRAAMTAGFSTGGPSSPRENRSAYENLGYRSTEGDVLGEGSLVQIAGYIVHADYSNENSGGENVNCNTDGADWNDIHINIASNRTEDDFCKTVVVEMSPHFRPRTWEEVTHVDINRPVRIRGPLFFDAAHKACEGTKRSKTPRRSAWEIHPIYSIEVCKKTTLTQCDAMRNSDWMPIEEWIGVE